tara:strand:- start:722 stop:1042 length:321 start_codon:yes stop_codon:yes gene_type:complete
MAINTRAYDWSTNNFGLAEWDDISFSFDELGTGQFFDSYSIDNFTAIDTPDDFSYTAVSAPTAPTLSGVTAIVSPTYSAMTVSSASYTDQSVSSTTFTEIVIAGEN